jgi:hypothetical protein
MKIPKPFLLIFAAILAFGALAAPKARAQVSADYFYNNLSNYGEWVQCSYGYCWHPDNMPADWAPYTDGYWAYTDAGWTWVSYEDFGGIVYHYGRWVNIYGEGWVWVPGTRWAPAWVSWRSSPDYVGWAPLPPEATFTAGFGFGRWCDARFNIGPGSYNFVGIHDFGSPALGGVIVNREQNINIVNRTTNITNITTINNTTINNTTIYNGGPSFAAVSAASSRPIPVLHLVRQTSAAQIQGAGGKILAHQQGNQLVVLAPKVTGPSGGKFPAPPHVAKTLADAKPDHGWDVVKDPQQRAQLQAKVKSEAPVYAAAKPVSPEELKVVNDRIKSQGAKPLATGEHNKALAATGEETPFKKKTNEKKTSETDLENAPAVEGGETPKPEKLKTTHSEELGSEERPAGGATPKPKHKKGKKSPTPGDESASSKHSDLESFSNGEEPKSKPKTFENEEKPSEKPKTNSDHQGDENKKKKSEEAPTP